MFEKSKGRYLTRGVDAEIPIALQVMMWQAVDQMPKPKDYLQVFRLSEENGLQIVHHTSEQPQFEMRSQRRCISSMMESTAPCCWRKSTDHKTSPNEHKNPSHNFILWLGFFLL